MIHHEQHVQVWKVFVRANKAIVLYEKQERKMKHHGLIGQQRRDRTRCFCWRKESDKAKRPGRPEQPLPRMLRAFEARPPCRTQLNVGTRRIVEIEDISSRGSKDPNRRSRFYLQEPQTKISSFYWSKKEQVTFSRPSESPSESGLSLPCPAEHSRQCELGGFY